MHRYAKLLGICGTLDTTFARFVERCAAQNPSYGAPRMFVKTPVSSQ